MTSSRIWSNRYTVGTGWGTPEQLETLAAADSQIAMDANGNALAVWVQGDGTTSYIWSRRYTPGSGWDTAMQVSAGAATSPQTAFDTHGNALVAWKQSDGTYTHIWSSRYTAQGGWGTPAQVDPVMAANSTDPQIASDTGGNALAVWQQGDGTRTNIWSNRYTADRGWGTAEMIETDNAGDETLPQIAVDAHGNALAVWQQSNGARTDIWSNRFESDNP
jgi:hypothetical protein